MDAGFLPYLRQIARDGVVPPWPQWFPEADPAELYPTEAARAAVQADARPLPLSFFEETLPAVTGQAIASAGYLLFSEGYQQEAGQAGERGWPVTQLPGTHLHPLAAPADVAAAITGLAAALVARALSGDGAAQGSGSARWRGATPSAVRIGSAEY